MSLQELINAHKVAVEDFERASERLEQVENAYEEAQKGNRVTVKIGLVDASADQGSEYLNSIADDVCERITRDVRIIDALSPTFAAQFQEGIAKIRAELTKKIEAAVAEETARQAAFGLDVAKSEWERLNELECQTLLEICRHRCDTLAEERQRIAYVVSTSSYTACADINEECSKALLQSAAGPIAA